MIVYYTTCNQRLYEISCKGLIASFLLVCNSSDKLYVFHENINYDIISPNVVYVNVENCEIYTSWFEKFTNAHAFIDDLMETYNNGKFLEYVRWDDGFVFRCLIGKEIHAPYCHDFVRKSGVKNVISEGPFKHKILHHIGKHLRLKINE